MFSGANCTLFMPQIQETKDECFLLVHEFCAVLEILILKSFFLEMNKSCVGTMKVVLNFIITDHLH